MLPSVYLLPVFSLLSIIFPTPHVPPGSDHTPIGADHLSLPL